MRGRRVAAAVVLAFQDVARSATLAGSCVGRLRMDKRFNTQLTNDALERERALHLEAVYLGKL